MPFTRLEKLAFLLLVGGILVGGGVALSRFQTHKGRNSSLIGEIRLVSKLTPRGIVEKDDATSITAQGAAPELAIDESSKLNVNQAAEADLEALPGLGKVLAQRICEYRQAKGEIKDLGELLMLKGMTPKKFAAMSRILTIKGGKSAPQEGERKLNLNFATIDEVEHLPGAGKALAKAIIDVRNQRGGFHSLDDLKDVPGLTEEKLEKFSDRIEVK